MAETVMHQTSTFSKANMSVISPKNVLFNREIEPRALSIVEAMLPLKEETKFSSLLEQLPLQKPIMRKIQLRTDSIL